MAHEPGERGVVAGVATVTRPPRSYVTGRVTRTLRWATWILVVVGIGTVAATYPSLPQTVPVHFDVTGTADRFGDRTSVLWLALLWLVLQGALTWLSTRPQVANYPVEVTDENAQDLYREGERLIVWVGLAMAGAFIGAIALVVTGAEGWSVLIGGGIVALLGACVISIGRMVR